jgi:hypothetical protein
VFARCRFNSLPPSWRNGPRVDVEVARRFVCCSLGVTQGALLDGVFSTSRAQSSPVDVYETSPRLDARGKSRTSRLGAAFVAIPRRCDRQYVPKVGDRNPIFVRNCRQFVKHFFNEASTKRGSFRVIGGRLGGVQKRSQDGPAKNTQSLTFFSDSTQIRDTPFASPTTWVARSHRQRARSPVETSR